MADDIITFMMMSSRSAIASIMDVICTILQGVLLDRFTGFLLVDVHVSMR